MTGLGRTLVALGAVAMVAAPGVAAAQEKVQVVAHVVHASNQGEVVNPASLASLKETFAKKNLKYSSWIQLSSQTVEVGGPKATELSLPNNTKAQLTLKGIEKGTATIEVSTVTLKSVTYKLGREGNVYVMAGDYKQGQLLLVLAPITEKKDEPEAPKK